MKHKASAKMVVAWLAALTLLIPLTACSTGSPTVTTAGASSQATAQATESALATATPPSAAVTISILIQDTGNKLENYTDSRTQQEMTKKTGVKIKLVQADIDKINVLLAGGYLPDMVRISTSKFNQMIEGDQVIALDDLLGANGKDIQVNIADTLAFSKKYWSDGKDKTYFIPVEVGADGVGMECWISGVRIRWDYYKELGYPKISSMDDFLNVLSQIVKKHPTTADGKPIYGVSSFSDWGSWPFMYPMASILGYYQINNSKSEVDNVDTNQVSNLTTDESAPYWKSVEYYYKARKMGLLDPDALTQKNADLAAKATAGQIISGVIGGDFNTNNAKDGKGFVNLPMDWGYQWGGAMNLAGWADKCFGITKNCKTPDKAMDLLNYFYSYDGVRTLFSGVEGTDWSIVNGTPTVSDDAIKLKTAGGDDWAKTGIGFDSNFIGLSPFTLNPTDKKPLNLFEDPTLYAKQLNPLQQDYCNYYKVTYPQEALDKQMDAGKSKNQSTENTLAAALLPVPSDDITRIEAKLDDLMIKSAAKLIMASSDAEYDTIKQQVIADFKAAGADTVSEYWSKAWDTAVTQSKAIQ